MVAARNPVLHTEMGHREKGYEGTCWQRDKAGTRRCPRRGAVDCLGAPGHAEMSEVMAEFRAGAVSVSSADGLGKFVVRTAERLGKGFPCTPLLALHEAVPGYRRCLQRAGRPKPEQNIQML